MASLLKKDSDALLIATLLCENCKSLDPSERFDINEQDRQLNTALHHAVMTKKAGLVKYLVE